MAEAYRAQYGFDAISIMPTNLYGPGDNFDLANSHVLPALMRKFHEAKQEGRPSVTIWGTGSPLREFLHVDDLAGACGLPDEQLQFRRDRQRRFTAMKSPSPNWPVWSGSRRLPRRHRIRHHQTRRHPPQAGGRHPPPPPRLEARDPAAPRAREHVQMVLRIAAEVRVKRCWLNRLVRHHIQRR